MGGLGVLRVLLFVLAAVAFFFLARRLAGILLKHFGTKRKRVEADLEEAHQRLTFHVENSPLAVIEWDNASRLRRWSPQAENIFGWKAEELLGKHLGNWLFVSTEDDEVVNGLMRSLLDSDEPRNISVSRNYTKDGSVVHCQWYNSVLLDESGNVESVLSLVQDVTERRRTEEELRARVQQQAAVAGLGQRALADIDPCGLMNEAVRLVAQTLDVDYVEVLERLRSGDAFLLKAGVGWEDELVGRATVGAGADSLAGFTLLSNEPVIVGDYDSEKRFNVPPLFRDRALVSGISVLISGRDRDQPFGVLCAHTRRRRTFTGDDIRFLQTVAHVLAESIERGRAEETLRRSEAKNRALLNAIPDMMFLLSKEGAYLDYKAENENQPFVPPVGFLGKTVCEILPTEVAQRTMQVVQRALESGGPQMVEYQLLTGEGLRDYEARIVRSGEDEVLSIVRDITDRKRAERALRESEERFRKIFDRSNDAMFVIDLAQDRILDANPRACSMLGYSRRELLSLSVSAIHPDEMRQLLAFGQSVFGRGSGKSDEFTCLTKSGEKIPAEISASPIEIDGRSCMLALVRDITNRKRAEEERRKAHHELELKVKEQTAKLQVEISQRQWAEKRYQALYEDSPSMFFTVDAEGKILSVNQFGAEQLGFTTRELRGQSVLDVFYPDDKEVVFEQLTDCLRNRGQVAQWELRKVRKDGGVLWVKEAARAVEDVHGDPVVLIVCQDITDIKRARAEIEEKTFTSLDQRCLGGAVIDKNGCLMFLSGDAQALFGKSQQEALGKHWERVFPFQQQDNAEIEAIIQSPPEDREKILLYNQVPTGQHHLIEVEVKDDPRNRQGKIFFFYRPKVHDLRRLLNDKTRFQDLVGKSEAMRLVYKQIDQLSRVDSTVLIEGETGTGKGLVARAIHISSQRKNRPFIRVNCAGLTESLLGSQLFGHKRGAFTGAVADQQGLFEAADGGTILLDEIGDIPRSVQTNLLHVLDEKEITRLGESKPRRVDVRVLAATNRDLSQEVASGNFRADLLYRIRVARIQLTPLRQRREDIPLLVGWFLEQCPVAQSRPIQAVSSEAMKILLAHTWPGNVRELENAIESAIIHCKGSVLNAENLPPEITHGKGEEREKAHILAALREAKWNRTKAARQLGMSRATLYRRMSRLNIESDH